MVSYALYGAGNQSLNAQQRIKKLYQNMQAKYLVENQNFNKIGQKIATLDGKDSLEVITPERLEELYGKGEVQAVFVPSGYHIFDLEKIEKLMKDRRIERKDVLTLPINVLRKPLDQVSESDKMLTPLDELVQICHLDVHVLDYCNLNCKACSHFAPLAKGKGLVPVERYQENFFQLKSKIPNICQMAILGGEPLLHPDLGRILEITRECYPYTNLHLVTNGLLLEKISQDLLKSIQKNDIVILLSLYPPLYHEIDRIISFLQRNHLRFQISRIEVFERRLFPRAWIDGSEMTKKCGHLMALRDNRIGRCVNALFTDYYNEAYGKDLPVDPGIDIYGPETGAEIVKKLEQPLELCNQCCARDHVYEPWEPMKGKGDPADWLIELPVDKM